MFFTREQILKMKEAQLQEEVLIPLFIAMGYKDVQPNGGNTEFGKDIVMWKCVDFDRRVNFAVVAKAKQISGSVSGNAGAHTVAAQIRQCFGKNYLDNLTSEEQRINQVFVISSKGIPQTAIDAIKSIIDDSIIDRSVTYINGDKLWEYIEQYMSERTVFYKLSQIKKMFDEVDPHYRITSTMQGNRISLSLEPKDPNAIKDHPLSFSGRFRFPDTPEGQAKREEYDRYIKTGSEVAIPKEYIEQFPAPDLFGRMLDPIRESDYELKTGSLPDLNNIIIVRVVMECSDGEKMTLEYIPLVKMQGGSEQMTLTNENQRVPWKFIVIDNFKEKNCTIQINLKYEGVNIKRGLEGFKFLRAISKGGFLRVEHWESGFSLWSQQVEPGALNPPDPDWINILEKMLLIQEKLGVPFVIPEENISFSEAQAIYETAYKLEFGRIEPGNITLKIERDGAKEILAWFESGKPYFSRLVKEDEVIELLGNQIHLGPVKVDILNGYLSEDALSTLRQAIESAAQKDFINIIFNSSEERPIIVEYANWLPTKQPTEEDTASSTEEEPK